MLLIFYQFWLCVYYPLLLLNAVQLGFTVTDTNINWSGSDYAKSMAENWQSKNPITTSGMYVCISFIISYLGECI